MRCFRKAFRTLQDPRAENARHDLLEILFIALAAVLCGAVSCSDMEEFGEAKQEMLRLVLRLDHGVPSHDTFSRVFRLLRPHAFEAAFRRFMAAFAKANGLKLTGVVAIDGKAVRGAYERGGQASPLRLVNVFAVEARMALAQRKAPGHNETAGALEVLDLLCLEGCLVTADALHCHRAFASAVLKRGGDYVLAIKANRGPLFKVVTQQFARSGARRSADELEPSSHDRREARRATIMRNANLAAAHDFPGVVAVGRVTSRRRKRSTFRSATRTLLSLVQTYVAQAFPARHTQSLGHREPASLDARCPLRRGRQPRPQGQRSGEPRHPAQARPQHPPNPSLSRLSPPQNQARRMGRRLSLGYNRPYAIALRLRERVGVRVSRRICRLAK
jgi:predicted transposase YbfD/YdcC